MVRNVVGFLLCCLAAVTMATDKEVTEAGVRTKIHGQSGKITIGKNQSSVTINFDYIHEVDSSNAIVGKKGKKKHSFNTFATQQFTFTTQGMQTKYQSVDVKHVQFKATLAGPGATLIVDIFVFKQHGNITAGSESFEVNKGTVKFNIKLSNWTFCGSGDTCGSGASAEQGNSVNFGIEIKGRKTPKAKSKKRGKGKKVQTLDIGGADCTLSGNVKADDTWTEMAAGYPKTETKGSKTIFIFKFPKFSRDVVYDPTLDLSGSGGDDNAASTLQGGMVISIVACLYILARSLIL